VAEVSYSSCCFSKLTFPEFPFNIGVISFKKLCFFLVFVTFGVYIILYCLMNVYGIMWSLECVTMMVFCIYVFDTVQ